MLCPKCKKEIEDKSLKCKLCGAKIGSLCKDCGAYNLITSTTCSNCGKTLIRFCSKCGAANLPEAKNCRKCNYSFGSKDKFEQALKISEFSQQKNTQSFAKDKLIDGISNPVYKIITLTGDSGAGKNLVLRSAISELKDTNLVWLMGTCSQISQLTPMGYIQDMLLNFFNINNFCPDTLQLKKNSIKFFKQDFSTLSNNEILDLLNLLYPENTDIYENIYVNKVNTFTILKKVIGTIIEKTKIVFIIDKFEFIDGMSFDFLCELLRDETVLKRAKFIILSSINKPGEGLISANTLEESAYLNIPIAEFSKNQTVEFIKQQASLPAKNDLYDKLYKYSKGNPSYLEQAILLINDLDNKDYDDSVFKSLNSIMEHRLCLLRQKEWKTYRILVAMASLGVKFHPAIIEGLDGTLVSDFGKIIDKLIGLGFISRINNLSFEFKSSDIWKAVISFAKNDGNFDEILNSLFEIISGFKQSSAALLGYIYQKLGDNKGAFDIWTLIMKHASYIGDAGLYIIVQKQALKLIENKNSEFYLMVKRNIYTRVGKLLTDIDYKSAFEFLQNAVMMTDENDDASEIELLGYIASCSMKDGNYFGAIECVDKALSKLSPEMKNERILLKSRTVAPLLKLGNYGELIQTVENDILPEIEKILEKGRNIPQIKLSDLFNMWVGIYFCYAEALVFQGHNKAFDVIQTIYEILDKNNAANPVFVCKTNLLLALANTIKGDLSISNKILDDMLKEYSLDSMDNFIVSRWNFIDILNKFFAKDYDILKTELFSVAAYANNVNDNFTKNILKTMLAKILKYNNQTKRALEILDEQVSYFAGEKVATGVLLSWYLIAETKLETNFTGIALDIATKALDIAQGANICNYYFTAMFNKLIGEIYIAKQDFDSAKVYLEKALFISKQFNLQYITVKTYLQCARLYQELALPKTNNRGTYIKQALKMFKEAKNVSIVAEQPALQRQIKEDLNILTSFCKLNGIILKKESK